MNIVSKLLLVFYILAKHFQWTFKEGIRFEEAKGIIGCNICLVSIRTFCALFVNGIDKHSKE